MYYFLYIFKSFLPQRRKDAKVFTCDYNSWWNFVPWRLGGNDFDA
jgi:hypothetical protein